MKPFLDSASRPSPSPRLTLREPIGTGHRPVRCFTTLLLLVMGLCHPFCFAADITVTASSHHPGPYAPFNAVDGDGRTRWASRTGGGEEFLEIDLGEVLPVTGMNITWEAAFAAAYDIAVSEDRNDWRSILSVTEGREGLMEHRGLEGQGRYVRIHCTQYGPHQLYSIWEIAFTDSAINQKLAALRQAKVAEHRSLLKTEYGIEEIVFAQRKMGIDPHWYANFSYYADSTDRKPHIPGGQLCKLNMTTGELTVLVDDPQGSVRDPVVHYDGKTILFSYRRGGEAAFHLWEINANGSGLRQITDGIYDDIEPVYLPDDRILFVSSRCKRWVNCWLTQVAILYRCDRDGSHVQQLSANIEQDNTPWVLPDGRVLYTRWEYVDRSQVHYHHLWTMNPDGTNQTVYYGNLHPGSVFIDAKPIPGTGDVLMIDSPGHGATEHGGWVTRMTNQYGPDAQNAQQQLNASTFFRDPYPLSEEHSIVACGQTLLLMDGRTGSVWPLYQVSGESAQIGLECHEPRPLVRRGREHRIPDRIAPDETTGRLILVDVYHGRSMDGIEPGSIKKLLVMETLAKPINYTGGMDPLTYGGSFTLEKILGTVPVEADGSAFMELPANRSVFFIALDENDDAVKRMQSFTSVGPGETSSCAGCHEQRTQSPVQVMPLAPLAARKPAARPEPVAGIPELFDFPRDIQPILDAHCTACHNPDKREGKVLLTGDHGPMYSHSYVTLTVHRQFVDGRNLPKSNYPPYALGARPSPLIKKIQNGHHGVQLSAHEINMIRYWIESAAVYPGTYAALGTGMIGGYLENHQLIHNDGGWPPSQTAAEAIGRRCDECHTNQLRLPHTLSDESGISFWQPDLDSPAIALTRHLVFNLTRPEKSLMLLVPLARDAGGYADNEQTSHPVVFETTEDADYQAILAMIEAGRQKLAEIKRFDMPGFQPRPEYIREMKRYGVLPPEFDETLHQVDIYELDEHYWRSLWYDPDGSNAAGFCPYTQRPETAD